MIKELYVNLKALVNAASLNNFIQCRCSLTLSSVYKVHIWIYAGFLTLISRFRKNSAITSLLIMTIHWCREHFDPLFCTCVCQAFSLCYLHSLAELVLGLVTFTSSIHVPGTILAPRSTQPGHPSVARCSEYRQKLGSRLNRHNASPVFAKGYRNGD